MMDDKKNTVSGVLLAGGQNSRMGGFAKGLIEVSGETIFERTLNTLEKEFSEIVIVANQPDIYRKYSRQYVIIGDILPQKGPLGGIHAALSVIKKSAAFFVACDMPFLCNAIISQVLGLFYESKRDAVVPRVGNKIEPLCAVYKKSLKDKIYQYISDNHGYSVRGFLEKIKVDYLDYPDNDFYSRAFMNVNTPEDARQI